MITIKRYANRKLYDPETRQYITLDILAHMIRQGKEVRVIDHATASDLTSQILTQVISDQAKRGRPLAPMGLFSRLIQAGDRKLTALTGALQAFQNPLQYAAEEIRRRLDLLVEEKAITPEQVLWLSNLLLDPRWEETSAGEPASENDELARIVQQINVLEEEIRKFQSLEPQP